MLEVCSPCSTQREVHISSRCAPANRRFYTCQTDARAGIPATPEPTSEYQNPVGKPYGLLPRPPQTQAAHFKRLYRK